MAKIDQLFLTKHPKVFRKPGHRVAILVQGYDAPPEYSVECSCGWDGRNFSTFVPAWPYPLHIQKFVDIFGPEALLESGKLYGTFQDAQREALDHLALPIEALVTEKVNAVQTKAFGGGSDALTSAIKLGELAKAVQWLLAARELMETTPRAERATPFNSEVYEAYQNLHGYRSFSAYGSRAPWSAEDSQKLEALQSEWRNLAERLKA